MARAKPHFLLTYLDPAGAEKVPAGPSFGRSSSGAMAFGEPALPVHPLEPTMSPGPRTAPGYDPDPMTDSALESVRAEVVACRRCPRLVEWREEVARTKVARFAGWEYWGRPVPGFGDPAAGVLIVGLAPAAHGGNRTGRIFTGDRSGDFLFASLYRTGFAEKPTSVALGDGQRLLGARMVAAVRCAPPDNKPEPAERDACAPWLAAELRLVAADLRVIVCLGGFAWQAIWPALTRRGFAPPRPRPAFGHGAEVRLANPQSAGEVLLIGCYHPSQQNTFTG